jgi:hypothetical protein
MAVTAYMRELRPHQNPLIISTMSEDEVELANLAPRSLILHLRTNPDAHIDSELLNAVQPWNPSKTMESLFQSISVRADGDNVHCYIDEKMLLLQDEALDSVIRWESDLDPSVRGIKKKVTEVLKMEEVGLDLANSGAELISSKTETELQNVTKEISTCIRYIPKACNRNYPSSLCQTAGVDGQPHFEL